MTIQQALNSSDVKTVEMEIIRTISDAERLRNNENVKSAVSHLLSIRKKMLDSMFVLTDENKQLLNEFNERLKHALCNMRGQMIDMQKSAMTAGLTNLETTGKVFMSYKYPENHPVQTMRAKKIWCILNNSYDYFIPMYENGVNELYIKEGDSFPTVNEVLYLSDDIDNWNEGLDRELTSDMHLCYGVHNLIEHCSFSIFDILWVRDFSIQITCESSHCTGSEDWDDIDWNIYDYL